MKIKQLGNLLKLLCTMGLFLVSASAGGATQAVQFGIYQKSDFSPGRGETFVIPYLLTKEAEVSVLLYTADNYLVRTLRSEKVMPAGAHTLSWDGKDSDGKIVPDEAYTPVLKAKDHTTTTIIDPRQTSGGEIERELKASIDPDGTIVFYLTKPSRVRVRAGIADGPMLRSLLNWKPRAAGKNLLRWNGMDQDNVANLLAHENYGVSVTAFRLPDYSIITTGNSSLDYSQFVMDNSWSFIPVPENKRKIERDEYGISPHYYYERLADKDPRIEIHLPDTVPRDDQGRALVDQSTPVPIKVTMNAEDEKLLAETKYEVSFFVDHQFMSEEELGFMPITWLWLPNNLNEGKHILTVNVSGFRGQVGVKSVEFMVGE